MKRRSMASNLLTAILLVGCGSTSPEDVSPVTPNPSLEEIGEAVVPLPSTATTHIIPAAELNRPAVTLASQSEEQIETLKVFPENILVTAGTPGQFYIKAYDANGADLGVVDTTLLKVELEKESWQVNPTQAQNAFELKSDAPTGLTRFRISLKNDESIQAYGAMEALKVVNDVTVIQGGNIKFPNANIDPDILTEAMVTESIAPFTKEEFSSAFDLMEQAEAPSFPVVVKVEKPFKLGEKVFLAGASSIFGNVSNNIAFKDGYALALLEFDGPKSYFIDYDTNLIDNSSFVPSIQLESDAPVSEMSSQGVNVGGGWECNGILPSALNTTGTLQLKQFNSEGIKFDTSLQIFLDVSIGPNVRFHCQRDNYYARRPVPLGGALGAVMHLQIISGTQVSGGYSNDIASVKSGLQSNQEITIFPKIEVTKVDTKPIFGLSSGAGKFYSADGQSASYKGDLSGGPILTVKLAPGPYFLDEKIMKKYSKIIIGRPMVDYSKYYAGEFFSSFGPYISGEVHSMRAVHTGLADGPSFSMGGQFTGGLAFSNWMSEQLEEFDFMPTELRGTVQLPAASTTMPELDSVQVTKDVPGAADIEAKWASGDVERIHLATPYNKSPNSLHAVDLGADGGTANYDASECEPNWYRLPADVLAVGYPVFEPIIGDGKGITLPLPLPFNTSKQIEVCNMKRRVGQVTHSWGASFQSWGDGEVSSCFGKSQAFYTVDGLREVFSERKDFNGLGSVIRNKYHWYVDCTSYAGEAEAFHELMMDNVINDIKSKWLEQRGSECNRELVEFEVHAELNSEKTGINPYEIWTTKVYAYAPKECS